VAETPRVAVATGFWLAILLGSIQAIVLAVAVPLYLPPDKLHLLGASRWFMIYLPAAYITAALLGIDQGRGRFGRFSVFLSLPGAFYVATILAAWASGHASPKVFAVGILSGIFLVAVVRTQQDWAAIAQTLPDWKIAQRLLKRGLRYYLPAVASLTLFRADMFILVRLAPSEAIGLYAVAQAVALGQIGAVNPFVQVGFSAVAREAEPEQALQTLARHFRLAQVAVVSVGVLAAAATPWLIRLMFGVRFAGAITATYLLISSTVLWGIEQVLEQGLRAAAHPRPGIVSNLLGLGVLVGLGIPACTHYGIVGLASVNVLAQFLNLAILVGFCIGKLEMRAPKLWAIEASTISEIGVLIRSCVKRLISTPNGVV
jgi:O-antigen/teichoic acid export membrane protein